MKYFLTISVFVLVAGGASAQSLSDFAGGVNEAINGRSGGTPLLIYGGENNKTFLGCLTCNELSTDAVTNGIGRYGSTISSTSITNKIGMFGSTISRYSPCNTIANHPPVVVDDRGRFYGELTVNTIRPQRIVAPSITAWLAAMCRAD